MPDMMVWGLGYSGLVVWQGPGVRKNITTALYVRSVTH